MNEKQQEQVGKNENSFLAMIDCMTDSTIRSLYEGHNNRQNYSKENPFLVMMRDGKMLEVEKAHPKNSKNGK